MSQDRLFAVSYEVTGTDDYYTPSWVFDRMDIDFDLDVCSPPEGIPWIPAARYFTQADDGLAQPWEGRVWMNPPYSDVTPWVRRFIDHRHGVMLLPLAKSWWLNDVWSAADAVTVSDMGGEMHFHRPDSPKPVRIWFPVFFAAFGAECVEAISRLGVVRTAAAAADCDGDCVHAPCCTRWAP
jgi:hypothetical protein